MGAPVSVSTRPPHRISLPDGLSAGHRKCGRGLWVGSGGALVSISSDAGANEGERTARTDGRAPSAAGVRWGVRAARCGPATRRRGAQGLCVRSTVRHPAVGAGDEEEKRKNSFYGYSWLSLTPDRRDGANTAKKEFSPSSVRRGTAGWRSARGGCRKRKKRWRRARRPAPPSFSAGLS